MADWIRVSDRLPDASGWYLVFAPTYSGGSSSGLECIDGVMFSKFKIAKNGNRSWSIEVGYHQRPGCVLYWMPLPVPDASFGHFEEKVNRYGGHEKFWIQNGEG